MPASSTKMPIACRAMPSGTAASTAHRRGRSLGSRKAALARQGGPETTIRSAGTKHLVMAAGSTEADTVPGVENLAVSGRKKQNAHEWRTIGPEAGLISVQYPATAHNPGGMLATTPERPAARDAVTTLNDHGVAKRSQGPGSYNMWIAAVDFVCGRSRQVACETSSTTRTSVNGSDSSPPTARGIQRRNSPAIAIASTNGDGSRPSVQGYPKAPAWGLEGWTACNLFIIGVQRAGEACRRTIRQPSSRSWSCTR
jgi:hypothetical protein